MSCFLFAFVTVLASFQHAAHAEPDLSAATIQGNSMSPALESGASIKVQAVAPTTAITRGQAVVMTFKGRDNRMIKRVYAAPNDHVSIQAGKLHLNGEIAQPTGWPANYSLPPTVGVALKAQLKRYGNVLPANRFIVLGDNPANSKDSLDYGLIERNQITGIVNDRS